MKDAVVQQLAPTLLAYSISKIYGSRTPPLLITTMHTKKVGTQTLKHIERRMIAL